MREIPAVAGAMPALLWELKDLLHLDVIDITGATLARAARAAR